MQRFVPFLVLGAGGLSAALGFLANQSAPELARPTFLAGVAGGGVLLLLGALAALGRPQRAWTIVTLAATGFVALSQAITYWLPGAEPTPGASTLALTATGMFLAMVVSLLVVAHAPVSAEDPTGDHLASSKDPALASAGGPRSMTAATPVRAGTARPRGNA